MTSMEAINKLIDGSHVILFREDDAKTYVKLLRDKYGIPFYIGKQKMFFQLVSYVFNNRLDKRHQLNLNRV